MSSVFATLVHTCILIVPIDTVLRAIGKRAHPLHVNAIFSSQCVLFSTIGCVPRLSLFSFLKVPLVAHPSMRIFQIPPVIPTRVLWLVIMFFVGVLSLIGQVCSSIHSPSGYFGYLICKDASSHGLPTRDSFSWLPRRVHLSASSVSVLLS